MAYHFEARSTGLRRVQIPAFQDFVIQYLTPDFRGFFRSLITKFLHCEPIDINLMLQTGVFLLLLLSFGDDPFQSVQLQPESSGVIHQVPRHVHC